MTTIHLITGGERSGKSTYAEAEALRFSPQPVYIATARIWDEEFAERVRRHQARRGAEWTNIEEEKALSRHPLSGRTVLIDCVTLWATNFFFDLEQDIDRALQEMKAELGEDPEVFLGYNPFHASIGVTLKSEYANAENLREIEKKLTADVRVMELAYRKDIMQTVNDNIRRIGLVLALLIALLMVISFVLISNTIRLLIYSKRFLIYTMRLVGATPEFIRRPFIHSAVVNGAVAGGLADMLLALTAVYLQNELSGLDRILPVGGVVTVCLVLPLLGVALSVGAAYFSVNRYLYMERGQLYSV